MDKRRAMIFGHLRMKIRKCFTVKLSCSDLSAACGLKLLKVCTAPGVVPMFRVILSLVFSFLIVGLTLFTWLLKANWHQAFH